jgi:small subunit ribosomal protein S4
VLERQFHRYFQEASKSTGVTGATLLQYLETRADNVVYRLGFAASRKQARQLVLHGHILVNGKKTTVPSFLVKPGQTVSVLESSRKSPFFEGIAKELSHHQLPEWLTLDAQNFSGSVVSLPTRQQIETPLKEQLIVEYYSR